MDGSRIKAVNNKDRNFTRNSLEKFIKAADERLADYLERLDEGDAAEKATGGARMKNLAEKIEALSKKRGEYDVMLRRLERTGEDQISLTDPDSRAMAAHTRVAVGYNVQVAVEAKHKLIVEQEVTNQVVDMGLLQATAEPAREIPEVERIDVVADKGYFKTEDIAACEKAGLTPYVPRPQRGSSVSNGFFRKDEFSYDPQRDAYGCPGGHELKPFRFGKLRNVLAMRLRSTKSSGSRFDPTTRALRLMRVRCASQRHELHRFSLAVCTVSQISHRGPTPTEIAGANSPAKPNRGAYVVANLSDRHRASFGNSNLTLVSTGDRQA